ncbi:MAG TPA: lysylphosphatidylglycerol synthase transmembrane domain-containing protein [Acidimicrobiales bacterium]|nr:lysylphosphatidylglycerol synthase transmembrane domain-containing protein [Acidimicrobiales bacterium]
MSGSPGAAEGRARGDVSGARQVWRWARYVVGLGLAALAIWALTGRRGELSGATSYLSHLNWGWLTLAVAAELASLAAFALVQRRLLAAAGVATTLPFMMWLTLAATAIANSMPAGPLVSSVFAYRQYRRRGADEGVAVWTLAAVFVAASITLAVVASIGVAVAGAEGSGLDLVGVTIAVLVVALAMGVVFVQRRALAWLVAATLRGSRRLLHWPAGDLAVQVDRIVSRLTTVRLSPRAIIDVTWWGVANWVLDCGCLALCFLAVGVGIPWKGLLLAYGAGQLAANLPVTPGGLGVVEGSLTIALVAFGGAETSTAVAVLLYRIVTFWGELPIGWVTWAAMTWGTRRDESLAVDLVDGRDMAEVVA